MLNWLVENEYVAATAAKLIAGLGDTAAGAIGHIFQALRDHGDKFIAAGITAFGVYKWWLYRERTLHERLSNYIARSDSRLVEGQTYILDAIRRPGPRKNIELPLFADAKLRAVLRENRWANATVAATVESSADWQLSHAIEAVGMQLKSAEDAVTSLRQQLATAHLIKGAIASADAKRSKRFDRGLVALRSFRAALQSQQGKSNYVAKELEAHQLWQLNEIDEARDAYQKLAEIASTISDPEKRDLSAARAMRYLAQIEQLTAMRNGALNCRSASWLLYEGPQDTAVGLISKSGPQQGWDLLEQADTFYLAAFVAHHRDHIRIERDQLNNAEASYKAILSEPVRFWHKASMYRLRQEARLGAKNIAALRANGTYDYNWLLPPLQQPKHQSDSISGAGGK